MSSDGEGAGVERADRNARRAAVEVDSVAITSTPATANTYIIGEDIVVTFTFDKNIAFSGTGSDPYIVLNVGTQEILRKCFATVGTPSTNDIGVHLPRHRRR